MHVTAFLDRQRRQAQSIEALPDLGKARGGHGKPAEGIVLMGVETKRDNERRRPIGPYLAERDVQRFEITLHSRPAWQRQVDVVAQPTTGAGLLLAAGVVGVELRGIDMERDGQNIVTVIEDALRVVTMVDIDIDDGDAMPPRPQTLCRDRRVVEEAEPARQFPVGMMAGGTAERIGLRLALQDQLCAGDCGLCGAVDCLP